MTGSIIIGDNDYFFPRLTIRDDNYSFPAFPRSFPWYDDSAILPLLWHDDNSAVSLGFFSIFAGISIGIRVSIDEIALYCVNSSILC